MRAAAAFILFCATAVACAQKFHLPTPNQAIFDFKRHEDYFVGTTGKPWTSGTFGCVRSGGWQMHEGIDIASVQRDKNGEPSDPIFATADGRVAYINTRAALSNYGKYIILQHKIDALEIYSVYAHLSEIAPAIKIGQVVKRGETIATMGRTTNTRESISKERAHLHFELNLFVNDRFSSWYRRAFPDQRNDHGIWNGQNLLGIDPQPVLAAQQLRGGDFNLLHWLQAQPELCRVQVRKTDFPWLKRYSLLISSNPLSSKEAVAGYEIALNYNGVPIQLVPRADSELKSRSKYHLISVNQAEFQRNPCRRLVASNKGKWELAPAGIRLLDLLTD